LNDADFWLQYALFEIQASDFQRANAVYWKATSTLSDSSSFVQRYEALK